MVLDSSVASLPQNDNSWREENFAKGPTVITILVDSADPAKIIINPVIAPLTAVEANPHQGQAKLTWEAGDGAVSYQIYALRPGASDCVLIGATAATNFQTNDPWLTDAAATPTVYVIVALTAGGAPSFFSDTAANKNLTPPKKTNLAPVYNLLWGN